VDLLEMQNQSLRDELAALKLNSEAGAISVAASAPNDDDPPPKYEEDYPGAYHKARRCSSSSESGPKDDDADAETMERAALTHSVCYNISYHTIHLTNHDF